MSTAAPLVAVVDDDPDICASLLGLLRSCGYRVEVFTSAEAFLANAEVCSAACVVSDVQMPGGMSGFELAGRLSKADRRLPIILVSAFADENAQAAARLAGAKALLKKPFDGCALMDLIDEAVAPVE